MRFNKFCQSWSFFSFNIWFCPLIKIFCEVFHFIWIWQGEFMSGVIKSFTQELSVSGHSKGFETWLFDSFEYVCIHLVYLWIVYLINLNTVRSSPANFLVRRGSPWTQHEGCLSLITCPCCIALTSIRSHSLESSWGHTNGRANGSSKNWCFSPSPFSVIYK